MNVVMLAIGFPPDQIGGTELYVHHLTEQLEAKGVKVTVVVSDDAYVTSSSPTVKILDATQFGQLLDTQKPDLVHWHPQTIGRDRGHLLEAHHRRVPLVATYHTATLSCPRGDLLYQGETICDGELIEARCIDCVYQKHGVPASIGGALRWMTSNLPNSKGLFPRRLQSAFEINDQVQRLHQLVEETVELVSHWVPPADWVRECLVKIGVEPEKCTVVRQGLSIPLADTRKGKNDKTVFGFVGRVTREKGAHLLHQAMIALKQYDFELRIVGRTGVEPFDELLRDSRVSWQEEVEPTAMSSFYRDLDYLLVPSISPETGPMVVLEAWSQGTPVIGSDRGGVAEWLRAYKGGQLFEAGNADSLMEALKSVLGEPDKFLNLSKNVPELTEGYLAEQMMKVYDDVVAAGRR